MIQLNMTPKSLERKLVLVIFAVVLTALLIVGGVIYKHQTSTYKTSLKENVNLIGETVAETIIVALRFDVSKDADIILSSLRNIPRINLARVYLPDGSLFARYERDSGQAQAHYELKDSTFEFKDNEALLIKKIMHDGDFLGFLVISHDLDGLKLKGRETLTILLSALIVSLFLAEFLAIIFLRMITRPIRHLIDVSMLISETGDLTIRADKTTDDDLGLLVKRYNQMLDQLQQNSVELSNEKEALSESRDRELELQERLSRSERMESLGILAGGVAHDLNNILGPLVGYPDIILDEMPVDAEYRHEIEQMQMATNKAAAVIQDLLTLARRGSYRRVPVNLNSIVLEYQRSITFQQLMDQHPAITCRCDLESTEPTLMGSEHHLTQVLLNLTFNAAEAMEGGGEILVRTRSLTLENKIECLEVIPEGSYAVLTVKDEGLGIPDEVIAHVFEPFYTRKELGSSGSGLGLSVVYGIVKDLDGYINLFSEEGKGTTFDLYFPLSNASVESSDLKASVTGGSESILVVDDLPIQRELATRILESSGYQIQTVCNGKEAIEKIQSNAFDLVLLDMIMEDGFDGLETYRGLRQINPEIRCIIVSGFSESDRVKQAEEEGVKTFLPKPYTRNELLQVVRSTLHPII